MRGRKYPLQRKNGGAKIASPKVRGEYAKAAADLEALKGEVLKSIRGESTFSKELL